MTTDQQRTTPEPLHRNETAELLRRISEDDHLLTAAHVAIEDHLIERRDRRIGLLSCANGFVVRERDGSPSNSIRLGTRNGIQLALRAIADKLEQEA